MNGTILFHPMPHLNFYQRILVALALSYCGFMLFFLIIDPVPDERWAYLILPFAVFPAYLGVSLFFFIVVSAFNKK